MQNFITRARSLILWMVLAPLAFLGCSEKAATQPTATSTSKESKNGANETTAVQSTQVTATPQTEPVDPRNASVAVNHQPADDLRTFPYPPDVRAPDWVAERQQKQLATLPAFDVFTGFRFTDRSEDSGIDFQHRSVDYACKINIAAHYDHGNGIAVADVNGDGLLDVYLTTQLGSNQLWMNQGNGRFENATTDVISFSDKLGVAASFADTDNDGDPDLYVTTIRDGNYFFENDGKGNFSDATADSGLDYVGHSSSGVFFDFDRDGLLDLFLCNVGVFTTNVRDQDGIYPPLKDAFAGHLKPEERNERSILYRNLGNNRFEDATEQCGLIDNGWAGAACPIDANEDGWPDLFVLNMQGHDSYYENVDGKRFERKSRERFPRTSWGAMGIQVFDFNNDGHMDIFVTDMHSDMTAPVEVENEKRKSKVTWPESFLQSEGNSVFGNSFFRNLGNGHFEEVSDEVGAENYWPWGLSTGDFNADGYEDVFIASSMNYPFRYGVNTLLLNNRGKKLLDSEYIVGIEPRRDGQTAQPSFTLDPMGEDKSHQLVERFGLKEPTEVWGALGTRSSVIFDVDNDGDLDIMTSEFNAQPLVLINNLTEKKNVHWATIKLTGKESNADGTGALVEVHAGDMVLTKPNHGQSGYLSQSVQPLYFGIGAAEQIDRIVVKWPSGETQEVAGPLDCNRQINITEE